LPTLYEFGGQFSGSLGQHVGETAATTVPHALVVLTPIVFAVIIMSQHTTFAQKIDVPFSTYDGSNLGFKIGYPNNWKITLLLESPTFMSPA
jgi:hypothetical protein